MEINSKPSSQKLTPKVSPLHGERMGTVKGESTWGWGTDHETVTSENKALTVAF